ncbi:MAG: hypothetical protein IJV85_02675 [Clostridia bacterium]|nr:hypothetical protein [Clostridia bacterium]
MKETRKQKRRSLVCFVIALAMALLPACEIGFGVESSSEPYSAYSSSEWESEESSSKQESLEAEESSSAFTPNEPDSQKTVEKEETDSIGHKVVYYTDGTYEDLGRIRALDFSSPAPETQYSREAFAKEENGEGLNGFYVDLYQAATSFHASKQDVTADKDGYYTAAQLDFSKRGITQEQAVSVWKMFAAENPAFYWISTQVVYSSSRLYLLVDEAYLLSSERQKAQTAIEKMALECDSYLSGLTTLTERALTIYDYLIYKIEYAYEEDGVIPETESWAHNLVGGATRGEGVCETYAKTFDYFCGLFGVDCLMVSGVAAQEGAMGAHAWNLVYLENEWRAVDVTWGDQIYLMRSWFAMGEEEFSSSHVVDTTLEWGIDYQYELPDVSLESFCPVSVKKDGGAATFYPSIDRLFVAADEGSRYEITLYPDTKLTDREKVEIYPFGAKFTSVLPKVEHLSFIGKLIYVDETQTRFYLAELTSKLPVKLLCSIKMQNVNFKTPFTDKNGYYLTIVNP